MLPVLVIVLLAGANNVHQPLPDTVDLSAHTVVLSVDDGYQSVFSTIYPLLKKHRMPMTLAVIGGCVGDGRPSYRPKERFLNQSEIREMIDSCGIEIASHTMSHPWLTRLDSATAMREIADSKAFLESLFNVPVITFVYPYGDQDERIRRFVARAGYKLARAVRAGTPDLGREPYLIPETELRKDRSLMSVANHIMTHQTTVLLLHRIVDAPSVFTEWPTADFAALLDWLSRTGARVTTLAQLYNEWWRLRLARELVQQLQRAGPRHHWLFEDVDVDATGTAHTR